MGGGGKRKREFKCIGGFEKGGFLDLRGISLRILFSLDWEFAGAGNLLERKERQKGMEKGRKRRGETGGLCLKKLGNSVVCQTTEIPISEWRLIII
ncbi:hypothetical protein AAC387_Pa07g3430 [Persea americana]